MNISQAAFDFISENEGYVPVPRIDSGGKLVWGHGHNQQPGEAVPQSISLSDADALLWNDLNTRYGPQTDHVVTGFGYTLTDPQFIAMLDFDFNLGMGDLHMMLSHGIAAVPDHILLYHYARNPRTGIMEPSDGLLARRKKELALFQS